MKLVPTAFIIFATTCCFAQNTIPKVLDKLNKKTVPYITVSQLKTKSEYILLDAREPKEFNVSHIGKSINVGFDKFDGKNFTAIVPNKDAAIVVYCSIGVRSEIIGEKLKKLGYKNVSNLYGGIFEWKNEGEDVINNKGVETDSVHAYNKEWSQYLTSGVKVYED